MIIAFVTGYKVVASSASSEIITLATENAVISGVTIEVVIAIKAYDLIVSCSTSKDVVSGTACKDVFARSAVDIYASDSAVVVTEKDVLIEAFSGTSSVIAKEIVDKVLNFGLVDVVIKLAKQFLNTTVTAEVFELFVVDSSFAT